MQALNYDELLRVIAFISHDAGLQQWVLYELGEDLHQVRGNLSESRWALDVDFSTEQAAGDLREGLFQQYQIFNDLYGAHEDPYPTGCAQLIQPSILTGCIQEALTLRAAVEHGGRNRKALLRFIQGRLTEHLAKAKELLTIDGGLT